MGKYRHARRTHQTRIEASVHGRDHFRDRLGPVLKLAQDLALALAAVADHAAHQLPRVGDRRAMGWVINLVLALVQ